MESKPQLTHREKRILGIYALTAIGVFGLFLILGWIRAGAQTSTARLYKAEIAVLVPLGENDSESGNQLLDIITKSKDYFVTELELTQWDITVRGYDTGNTSNSAAWAAVIAARNPNTVAIIGPMNTRQVDAIAKTVLGKDIPVITPASTAPTLLVSSNHGIYRIPATDDLQGPAIVDFLVRRRLMNVFLFVEGTSYTQYILDSMLAASNERIKFVGTVEVAPQEQNLDFVKQIEDSEANAIVYLGGIENFGNIAQVLNDGNVDIPIIGGDNLNDPQVASILSNNRELYFASPIYSDNSTNGIYSEILNNEPLEPYYLECIQATWLVLNALSSNTDGIGRVTVWENLPDSTIRGLRNERLNFVSGQLSPRYIYIYKGTNEVSDWFKNPIDEFSSR